jgi:hypothetical protein
VLTKGGKAAGIKKLCASALGIPGTQAMWNGIELDKWVTKIYNEGRSQFGHGGFLGLQSDLPITVIDSLDLLTVVLEIFVSRLAEYQGDDDAKAYSDWMEANPPKKPVTP